MTNGPTLDDLLGSMPGGLDEAMREGQKAGRDRVRMLSMGAPDKRGPWDGAFLIAADATDVAKRFRALADR